MKHSTLLKVILVLLLYSTHAYTQVSISESLSSPDESAILDLISQDKGFLAPRLTKDERDAISNPATSLLIFQTDNVPGFYYNEGTPALPLWKPISSESNSVRIPISSLPFSITESGSYYLTTSIDAGNNNGILIDADNVSIDLNGFSLIGDGTTSNTAVSTVSTHRNINLFNGFIDNWGSHGVNFQNSSIILISHVTSTQNTSTGILSGSYSNIQYCNANDNGFDGISANSYSTLSHCITSNNTADGIDVGNQSLISFCNSNQNGDNGIEVSSNTVVNNSSSNYNTGDGINTGSGADIQDCKAAYNTGAGFNINFASTIQGNQSKSNDSHGILAKGDSYVTNNMVDNNADSGFLISGNDNRIDGNQSTDNTGNGYEITGSGNLTIRNSASGNSATNYNVAATNTTATIITTATINTNNNPFANISF